MTDDAHSTSASTPKLNAASAHQDKTIFIHIVPLHIFNILKLKVPYFLRIGFHSSVYYELEHTLAKLLRLAISHDNTLCIIS